MPPKLSDADRLDALIPPGTRSTFGRRSTAELTTIDGSGPAWARGLTIPDYALGTEPPVNPLVTQRYMPVSSDAAAPVLPSLFMPGFPKCATTSLYTCLLATFTPSQLGCGDRAEGWGPSACKRRFLLAPLETKGKGHFAERKETFFYGGALASYWQEDLMAFHGPNPRAGSMVHAPPLWAWEAMHRGNGRRASKRSERLATIAELCQNNSQPPQACLASAGSTACRNLKRAHARRPLSAQRIQSWPAPVHEPLCSTTGVASRSAVDASPQDGTIPGVGLRTCTHPGCTRVAPRLPSSSGGKCVWEKTLHGELGRSDLFCVGSLLPWVAERELNATIIDFTPNYLCDPRALPRMRATAPDPAALRFVVVMRDPVMRAFSEWSMFSSWGWDPTKTFTASLLIELRRLRKCNATLYENASLLRALPTAELATYMRRCFRSGQAMMYVETSMYAVCLLHALRHFRREQFLFLRYEDLMRMDRLSIVALVARFAGLDTDAQLLQRASAHGKCSFGDDAAKGRNGRPRSSYSSSSVDSAELLAAAAPQLERLFSPYVELLRELVHPDFRWYVNDHRKTPLNASQIVEFLQAAARKRRGTKSKSPAKSPRPRARARAAAGERGEIVEP